MCPKSAEKRPGGNQITLLITAIYGGYFGAGLGQIGLAAMIIAGHNEFHTAKAMKNAVISAISVTSATVYIISGSVAGPYAALMMVGTAIGGFTGARMSQYLPVGLLRRGIIVFGVILTFYYFMKGV